MNAHRIHQAPCKKKKKWTEIIEALAWYLSWLVLPQYTKVVGSIPSQGTYKSQPMNTKISGTTNHYFSFSIFLSLKSI